MQVQHTSQRGTKSVDHLKTVDDLTNKKILPTFLVLTIVFCFSLLPQATYAQIRHLLYLRYFLYL